MIAEPAFHYHQFNHLHITEGWRNRLNLDYLESRCIACLSEALHKTPNQRKTQSGILCSLDRGDAFILKATNQRYARARISTSLGLKCVGLPSVCKSISIFNKTLPRSLCNNSDSKILPSSKNCWGGSAIFK